MRDARSHYLVSAHLECARPRGAGEPRDRGDEPSDSRIAEKHFEVLEEGCASRQGARPRVVSTLAMPRFPIGSGSLPAAPRIARNAPRPARNPTPQARARWQARPDGPGGGPGRVRRAVECFTVDSTGLLTPETR